MAVERSVFATEDYGAAEAALNAAYGSNLTWAPSEGEPFELRMASASDHVITVSTIHFTGTIDAEIDGMADTMFMDVAGGRWNWTADGRSGTHELPVLVPAGHGMHADLDRIDLAGVSIRPATVNRWFARYGGLPPSPALLRNAEVGNQAIRHALRLYVQIMDSPVFENELVRANLLDVLLAMTAQHLLLETRERQAATAPGALLRAQDYLQAHAAEPISIGDAAEASRLSIRGMQDQFKRHLDLTPAQYLRNVRLESVRAELVAAHDARQHVTISEVARRWGFLHMGRFAQYYSAAYGESPRETLR